MRAERTDTKTSNGVVLITAQKNKPCHSITYLIKINNQ